MILIFCHVSLPVPAKIIRGLLVSVLRVNLVANRLLLTWAPVPPLLPACRQVGSTPGRLNPGRPDRVWFSCHQHGPVALPGFNRPDGTAASRGCLKANKIGTRVH